MRTSVHMNSYEDAAEILDGGSPRARRYHPGRGQTQKRKGDPFRRAGIGGRRMGERGHPESEGVPCRPMNVLDNAVRLPADSRV